MCGYTLATNWQNFTEIHLAQVKILQKVWGGVTFLTHTVDHVNYEAELQIKLSLSRDVTHIVTSQMVVQIVSSWVAQ